MQSADYTKLADPELFEERRHVREKLERLPPYHADRLRLAQQLDAVTEESDRRARGEAAPQAASGQAGEQQLATLQWHWGEAYLIGCDEEHGWWAARRDLIGGLITESGPDELRVAIIADYSLKPVPRDCVAGSEP